MEALNKSETIKELAAALAKAQGEFSGAAKDTANPFFKSKYADLESCVAAIKSPLAKHGLSFVQVSHDAENAAAIETIILHASGEWLSAGTVSCPVSKHDAQGFGSAMTYARRYSLSAAFGIAPEDDDGNAAAKALPASKGKEKTIATFETEAAWIKAASSLSELGEAWKEMSAEAKVALTDLKNARKEELSA